MNVKLTECMIDAAELATLVRVASDQLMFPSFRKANPEFTQKIQNALDSAAQSEEERHERCYEFAKSLSVDSSSSNINIA